MSTGYSPNDRSGSPDDGGERSEERNIHDSISMGGPGFAVTKVTPGRPTAESPRSGPGGRRLAGRTGGTDGSGRSGGIAPRPRGDRLPHVRRVLRAQRRDRPVQLPSRSPVLDRPVERHHQLDLCRRQWRPGRRRYGRHLRGGRNGQPGPEPHGRTVAPDLRRPAG